MSTHYSRWIVSCAGLAVTLVSLVGCSAGPLPSTETPPVTIPIPSPTVIPSPTPRPPTHTPTLPSSPALTPTCTATPSTVTSHPTLTVKEEQAFVKEMLVTNGDCELPCWWGITPRQTTWQEVKERLGLYYGPGISRPGGIHLYEVNYGDLIYPSPPPYGYHVHIEFTVQNGKVRSIGVGCSIVRDTTPERFPIDWYRYSLDQVLTRHGAPSQIMLEFWPNPPGPYYPYSLFVFYDQLGILIRYGGSAIPGEPFRMCPELVEIEHLNLWLQSPGEGPALLELANLDRAELAQLLTLEEATGMDIQTFYETFKKAGAAVCLESPAAVWP